MCCQSTSNVVNISDEKLQRMIEHYKTSYPDAPVGQAEYVHSDEFRDILRIYVDCVAKQPEFYDGKTVRNPKLKINVFLNGNPKNVLKRCSDNLIFYPIYVKYSLKDLEKICLMGFSI